MITFIFSIEIVHAQPVQNSLVANNITNFQAQENKSSSITLTATTSRDLAKVPLNFSIVQKPKHGDLSPETIKDNGSKSVSIKYNITKNYTGPDSFTFKVTPINASHINSTGIVSLIVVPPIQVPNNIAESVEENKIRLITLTANTTRDLAKVPLNFSIVQNPKAGKVDIIKYNRNRSVTVGYVPRHNYTGPDSFTFRALVIKTNQMSNIGNVSLVVKPTAPFITDPGYRVAAAFSISLIIDFLIFLIAYAIIRGRREKKEFNITIKFWDIIRDENWYPSLARFQFILWTGIIIFAFAGVTLTRLFSGVGLSIEISSNILLVMGLSAGTAVAGGAISRFQYAGTTPTDVTPTKEIPTDRIREKLPGFKTMLMENDKITLSRFQMFAWTWIGIATFLGLLFSLISGNLYSFELLHLPDFPTVLLVLMGIGQGTYLSAKSARSSFFSINEVRYEQILLRAEKNFITILGSNFGSTGSVWLEYYRPVTKEEMQNCPYLTTEEIFRIRRKGRKTSLRELAEDWKEQYRYQHDRLEYGFDITKSAVVTPNLIRQDTRIVVSLDDIIYKLKSKESDVIVEEDGSLSYKNSDAEYVVRVEKNGLLTYANSDAVFKITTIPPKAEDLSYSTEVNKPVETPLKASDPDVADILTFIKVSDPSNGTLSNLESNTGKIIYTPKIGFVGDDTFTYKANDSKVDSNIATIKISVTKSHNA